MKQRLTALVLARCQRWRRKREALHLCRLGQQWPSSCLGGHLSSLHARPLGKQRKAGRGGCGGRVSRRGRRLFARMVRLCAVVGRTTNCSNARAAVPNPQSAGGRKNVENVQMSSERIESVTKVIMYSITKERKPPQGRVTMDYTAADLGALE
jgi:hypothetical protein